MVKLHEGDSVRFLEACAYGGAGVNIGDIGRVIEVTDYGYHVLVGESQYQNIRIIAFEQADQVLEYVEPETIVIFRYWKSEFIKGEVIALFPTVPSSVDNPNHCESYMHVGQHSGADPYYIINSSKPATPEQYNALKVELERLGYNLKIRSRCTYAMHQERRDNWDRMMGRVK